MSDDYYGALHDCAIRYRDMLAEDGEAYLLTHNKELWEFVFQFMYGCRDRLPLMKLNRWLGYIQGCLIERGYTTVEAERNWTRPLFRPLDYFEEN